MAAIGTGLVAQEAAPVLLQSDFVASPEPGAVAQRASRKDVVTLTGRSAETDHTRTGNNDEQFGEAAAFFFAESQSFHIANGSGGSQSEAPSVPALPVKLTTGGPARRTAATNSTDSRQNPASLAGNAAEQGASSIVAANLGTNGATSAASEPPTSASNTPLAELAQLDRTLQQIGIDPQTISLFNRMAMLLYANDPAALKILVQTLQSGAEQVIGHSSVGGADTNQVQANTVQNLLSDQRLYAQPKPNEAMTDRTQKSGPPTPITSTPASQPSPLPQLSDLTLTFAAVGAPQITPRSHAQLGQFLNVTF